MQEAYGFVMSDAIPEPVDCVKFIEDILVVVLDCRGVSPPHAFTYRLILFEDIIFSNSQNLINSCYSKYYSYICSVDSR